MHAISTSIRGSASFASSDTQKDAAISPGVTLSRAVAFTGTSSPSGGGKTPFSTDDNPGPAMATLNFTSTTNLRLTRSTTQSSTADIGWFVIEFSPTRVIYTRFLDYPTNGWQTAEVADSQTDTVFARPSIGLDKDNTLHALYVASAGPQLYYNVRLGGSWGIRFAVDSSSDNPTLMVRAPNDATYGGVSAGLYWRTSTSETYFFIPEFEFAVIPVLVLLAVRWLVSHWRRPGNAPRHDNGEGGTRSSRVRGRRPSTRHRCPLLTEV